MNNVRKYVVSTTLDKVEWNNSRLLKGDSRLMAAGAAAAPMGEIKSETINRNEHQCSQASRDSLLLWGDGTPDIGFFPPHSTAWGGKLSRGQMRSLLL